jgi:hypothetical protein
MERSAYVSCQPWSSAFIPGSLRSIPQCVDVRQCNVLTHLLLEIDVLVYRLEFRVRSQDPLFDLIACQANTSS